jgi:hypothetical protein
VSEVMALIGEARAAGIVWRLDGETLKFRVPLGTESLLARLRAARRDVETVLRAELMFDGQAMATGMLQVKVFATERGAQSWADSFAYARRLCRLEPLVVAPMSDGSGFGVWNPDYGSSEFRLDDGRRIARRTSG